MPDPDKTDRWDAVERHFYGALGKPPQDRGEFLERACGADTELRREVESLLAHHDAADSLLENPALAHAGLISPVWKVGTMVGPYRIVERLGAGGMGEVFRARDTKLGRDVALKTVARDRSYLDRLRREALVMASLNHANVATLYSVEEAGGVFALAMELIEGETLAKRMTKGRMKVPEAVAIAVQIAEGVDAAHRKGVIHRDLKPGNVMITRAGKVKVLDFGLAKQQESDLTPTASGAILGTAGYMSPEQAEGGHGDARSDIFSFGAVLYELLAGRRAFAGDTAARVMSAVLRDEPEPIAGLPAELARILRWCLRKDPEQRFQSITDVKLSLQEVQQDAGKANSPTARSAARKPWAVLVSLLVGASGLLLLALDLSRPQPFDPSTYRFRPVATDAEVENDGTWSPDGKSIVYLKFFGGRPQVMTRSLASGSATQLTRLQAGVNISNPFFSVDGERVYFVAGGALWSVAAVGGEPREVLKQPVIDAATLSPDGKTLALWRAYKEDGKTYTSVWISSPPGAPPRKYQPAPFLASSFLGPTSLRFSPDGKRIALATNRVAGERWVWSLPWPDGSKAEPRQLFAGARFTDPVAVDWLPDSRRLCLSIAGSLWLGDSRSDQLRRMTATPTEMAREPSVAPGGDRVLFTAVTVDLDVVELPLDGSPPRTFLATARNESSPSWTANGDAMAYITDRSGETEIWLRSPGGAWDVPVVRQSDFPDDLGEKPLSVALSPDGRRLAYVRHDKLWISPASGGRPSPAVMSGNTRAWCLRGRPTAPRWLSSATVSHWP